MPQHVSKQSALSSLLGRSTASCITAPQSGASAFKPSIDAIPLRVLGGSPFESRRWTGGIDPRICQSFAASPAEAGELPFWFSESPPHPERTPRQPPLVRDRVGPPFPWARKPDD